MSLMKPSSYSNCESDSDIHLMTNEDNTSKTIYDEESSDFLTVSISSSYDSLLNVDMPLEEREPEITLKNCSNTYFSGYLAMKCVVKFLKIFEVSINSIVLSYDIVLN